MVEVYNLKKDAPKEVVDRVRAGEVFIYPTDTVYGIGCDATNAEAVERVRAIKGNSPDKPFSIAFSDLAQVKKFIDLDPNMEKVMEEKLPGPFTLIVERGGIPKFVTGGLGTVGVRVPDCELARDLLRKFGKPIITTSANPSRDKAPKAISEIQGEFLGKVDFAIDGGPCKLGTPSSIIDLTRGGALVR
ncbi:MAG: threonylcarbamoyl-AMP synthase [Candidatus Altiarchaeota archaeon]|nr:threonylcarbamoyl-AMP synthase [Candidatus Altiarchaeota archaeon]